MDPNQQLYAQTQIQGTGYFAETSVTTTANTANGITWINPNVGGLTTGSIAIGNGGMIQIDNTWIQGQAFFSKKRKRFFGKKDSKHPELQARAFFKIVKKGLTKIEQKHFQKLAEEAFEQSVEHAALGQKNVAERFEKIMNVNLKKAAADLKGYDTVIRTEMIEKYRDHLPKTKELVIDDLEEYDKPLPKHAKVKLARAKKENIFDSFCVFWIREVKDPILFGQINEEPNVYYFIDEWDDDISVDDLLRYK